MGTGEVENFLDNLLYDANEDDEGNIIITQYTGEKSWEEEKVWKTLAPFLAQSLDPCVTCHGEEGHSWRYKFPNGKLKELTAVVTWE